MVVCDGLPVSSVVVDAERPTFRGAFAWWRKFARAAGLHHETTSEGLIKRFVTLDPGERCTEFRRSESERILRAQPYLAEATVVTRRDGDSVRVEVSTVDEVPLVGGARLDGAQLRAASLGTMNFVGAGMHVELWWEQQQALRQGFGGRLSHPQLFGRPYTVLLEGLRRPLGEWYVASVSHAFLTDLQRVAWHTGYSTSKNFVLLRKTEEIELFQAVDRSMWDVGGVLRFGPPHKLGLIGGMLLGERLVPRPDFLVEDSVTGRLVRPTDTAGVRQYPVYDATQTAAVLGVRALRFSQMQGLDALEAIQDVATGSQVGAVFGLRPGAKAPFRETFASVDIYVGNRSKVSYYATRVEAESRLDLAGSSWSHLVGSGRAAWYYKPGPRWTSELSIEGAGVWRSIIPFQLELGDRRSGLRGFGKARQSGSQRLLARYEHRLNFARYQRDRAALGAALFADAGRLWAGDIPFGSDTPIGASVGAAFLAAVPARSQRTVRIDIALPVTRSNGGTPGVRFLVSEPTRGFWIDPPNIRWARLSAVPEQIFSWP